MYGTMAANDAFTAGVRPGGLTSSTEIRLLLCYLVKNAGPIARQEIENALMEEALVNRCTGTEFFVENSRAV